MAETFSFEEAFKKPSETFSFEEALKPEEGFIRQAADIPVGFVKGAVGATRSVADIFGTQNIVSQSLRGIEDIAGSLLSAQAQQNQKEVSRIMEEAKDKGVWEQVLAAVEAVKTAPLDLLSQGAGSIAPMLIGGAGARLAGAGVAGTKQVVRGIGTAMGAGATKSAIYDAVKQELGSQGFPPDVVEKAAEQAQSYGENFDQIALGALLGRLSSTTGAESAFMPQLMGKISQRLAEKGVGKFTQATLGEAGTEFLQSGQEQIAQNIALQRMGVDVPTFQGAVGQGTLGAIIGGGVGAGASVISRGKPAAAPAEETPEAKAPAAPSAPAKTFEPTSTDLFQRELEIAEARERGEIVEPEPAAGEIEGIELDPAVKADIESVLQPGMTEEQARPVVQSIVDQNLKDLPTDIRQQVADSVISDYLQKTQSAETVVEPTTIKAPTGFRYSLVESPAYEGIDPLSVEDADFELSVLLNRAEKGRLTPEIFAQSEIAKRLDTAQVMSINEGLRVDPVATVNSLAQALQKTQPSTKPTIQQTTKSETQSAAAPESAASAKPVEPGFVRVYHSGSQGEGDSGRWVSTDKKYASAYRPGSPLFYTDLPANDPRVNNPDYADQGVAQGFTFNFELTPEEAKNLKPISFVQPVAKPTAPEDSEPIDQVAPPPVSETKIKAEKTKKQAVSTNWPSDIPTSLFRGYGREDYGSAYGMTASPIAGKGKYFAFNEDAASYYGPNIEKAEAPLKNPYVIRDGNQWAKLTKEAGWEFANPASLPVEKVEEMTQRLQNILKDRGYDGMIVYWDYLSPYDIGPNKENYRTLNKVFGVPQAVVFEKTKPTKAAKKESTPVETSRVRYGFDPVAFQETGTYSLVPVDQGGALFKTKQEAQKAKKFQADTRLQAVEGGYTLIQKRPDEIKADLLKAERMRKMPVAKGPLDILQFLASKGGLSPTLMSEISTDKNIRLGNRFLFAAKGKGLNESIAAEMAAEAGYITDDENLFDVINDSIKVKPRYSINDMDQVAEARYEDYLQAIEEAGDVAGIMEQSGFSPENIQAANIKEGKQLNEVAALITHANNLGIDVYGIEENVAARTEGLSQEQYEAAVAAELERAINQAEQGGVSEFGKTADVEEDGLSPFDVDVVSRAKPVVFYEDIPNESWLNNKIEDAVLGGTNQFGVPRKMGSVTGYFESPVLVPVDYLANIPGERGEQANVRPESLDYIRKNWDEVSKNPPYIEVDPFGKAWVSEGNHRIMVAKEMGLKAIPVEIRYFSGGQRKAGALSPENIARYNKETAALLDLVPGYRVTGTIETEGDLQALNEDIRDTKIREYQGLKQRLSAVQKRFIEDKSRPLDNELYRSLYRRAEELKAEIDATKPKRSSPEDFMARAAKALADGDMNRETFDVIDAMFKKNPKFLDGLRLSVKEGPDGAAGQFNPIARIVRLFKSKGAINPGTARHEFAHSMEQMMPADARQKIVDKWLSSLKKAMETDKSDQAQIYFKKISEFLENPTQARMNAAIAAMPSYEYYQYLNPSEYWAVNAEPLMNAYLGSSWQRFKMSMKGMLEAVKKVFGLNNNSEIYTAFKNAINGERRTTEMLIDYINSNLRIYDTSRRNYANNPAPSPSWDTPPEVVSSKVFGAFSKTKLAYKFQDKLVDLKDVQKAIQKEGREISDASNAYLRETLYHKRVADKVANFLKKDADPLLQEMQKRKVTLDELNKYLHAKFAEERNRHIANINPAFPDGGSGLMTQEARDYLASLPKDKVKDLEAVNSRVRKIVADTQNEMVRMGLETQQTVDAWNAQFPNYVPLFREDVDFVHHGTGMGMGLSSRGPASKAATGSSKDVSSILDSIFEMREKAIVRGEKARVGRALYALAVANPNPNFWLPINPEAIVDPASAVEELKDLGVDPDDIQNLMAEPKVAVVERIKDPVTGKYRNLVVYRVRPNSKFSDNVFPVRINGKDRYIFFNPKEERAIRLSKSLKNLDTEQLDMLTQQAGKITRFIASMSTQYNPIFGMWNFLRDTQGAALNLSTTPLRGQQAAVLSDAFRIIPELYMELRAQRRGEAYQSDIADDYRLFSSLGGPTGYRDQFVKLEEKGRIVERRLRELNAGNVRSVVQSVGGWLSDYNDTLENAIRLAAFRKAIDSGMSQDAAAGLAKELTVNFNRKGAKTPGLSAMYAFFNAAIQGNARLLETLKGPAGKKIIAGGILLGVFQSMLLQAFGLGDDEPPEFTKQRNLIIPTGEGQYLMWPMPLGFNFLPTLGRLLTEAVYEPRFEMRKSFGKILEAFTNSFNPLGGGGFMQTISPTIIDPFVAVYENRDAFGRPISREDRATNPSPGYLRSREQASEFSKVLAEILNYMTFGSEYTKGMISPTADDIDYIAGQYLGGVAREAMRAKEFVQSSATGEPIEPHRIPLVGKIVGDLGAPAAIANKFYGNITRLAEHEAEIKGRMKKRESPAEYLREYPEARLFQYANKLENEISKINRTIRQLQEMEGKERQIENLKNRKTEIMKKFNERYDAAAK